VIFTVMEVSVYMGVAHETYIDFGSAPSGWQSVSKAMRKLDTIDMNEQVKADIIKDAEYYYSEES